MSATTTEWFAFEEHPARRGSYEVMTWCDGDRPYVERVLWDGGWKWGDDGAETLTPDMVWRGLTQAA